MTQNNQLGLASRSVTPITGLVGLNGGKKSHPEPKLVASGGAKTTAFALQISISRMPVLAQSGHPRQLTQLPITGDYRWWLGPPWVRRIMIPEFRFRSQNPKE